MLVRWVSLFSMSMVTLMVPCLVAISRKVLVRWVLMALPTDSELILLCFERADSFGPFLHTMTGLSDKKKCKKMHIFSN